MNIIKSAGTPMGKMAAAFRKMGWMIIATGSFSIAFAVDEKHLIHGFVAWWVCQISAYLIDELDGSAFGSTRKQ